MKLLSHVLGYMGGIPESLLPDYEAEGYEKTDQVGVAGLEYSLENEIGAGRQTIEVDVNGHKVRTIGDPMHPRPGHNLVLTLDLNLQKVATRVLQQSMDALNQDENAQLGQGFPGVVVALDPRNGAIRSR